MNRPRCKEASCNRIVRQYKVNGKMYYDKICEKHHKLKYGMLKSLYWKQYFGKGKPCELCGWNEGSCDKHRKDKSKGYTKDNIEMLCPNCHSLIHQCDLPLTA